MSKLKIKIEDFINWLHLQLGSIYVWGAQGEKNLSDAQIRSMETSEENAVRAITLKRKRQAEGMSVIRAFDCSGLIVCYLLSREHIKADINAAGLYGICAPIERTQLLAGDLVFRHNGVRVHHVGVYVGENMVIHSKGRDVGVVKEHINNNGEAYWNKYGRLSMLQEGDEDMAKVITKSMKGSDIKTLQTALNELGYSCGAADGIAGDKTMRAIQDFAAAHVTAASILPSSVTVNVKVGSRTYTGTAKV